MKRIKLIKSNNVENEFILVFSPHTISINKELNNFIECYTGDKKITLKMDLIAFVGARPERFIKLDIMGSRVIEGTVETGVIDEESEEITLNVYSKLPIEMINSISPISYRRRIINNMKDAQIRASF